jgi:acyl-CoA reductase-like NAD-dependent aldehyde dehydrogenase
MVEVIRRLESATAEDADAAIDRAKAVFPGWRDVEPADRARLLRRLAEARENLVVLESQNVGKPIASAQGEITMVVETYDYYADAPGRLLGDTIPVSGGVNLTFRWSA